MSKASHWALAMAAIGLGSAGYTAGADGIYRNGVGARAMAMGGADVAYAADALGALAANPAGLAGIHSPDLTLGGSTALTFGHFDKPGVSSGDLENRLGVLPDVGFAMPMLNTNLTLGFGFITDSGSSVQWNYTDPPGGLGGATSYGYRRNKSEILLLRSTAGIGINLWDRLSLGGSMNVIYNKNTLEAPYIFQVTPGLAGAKTLLDLTADGFGVAGLFGLKFQVNNRLELGATYRTETGIFAHGEAVGDAGTQLGVASFPFHYEAQVKTTLPQMTTLGGSWQIDSHWRLALQWEWVNWGGAFKELPVRLRSGSNPGLPSSLDDAVPLQWRDAFVYRIGGEYKWGDHWAARGGYSFGNSPVPNQTLTPLTAVILEHTFTAGLGYRWRRYSLDLAYQWDIPARRSVGNDILKSGEYENSSTEVGIHWLAATFGIHF